MTPRTRSLYAYVGESHQPYQSPSKDLDMINGRISGRLPHVMGVQVLLLCFHCPARRSLALPRCCQCVTTPYILSLLPMHDKALHLLSLFLNHDNALHSLAVPSA